MTNRFEVIECPYGLTFDPDQHANFGIIDRRPEIETYETKTGAVMTETKAPTWRHIAWMKKRQHAEMICEALNAAPDLYLETARTMAKRWREAQPRIVGAARELGVGYDPFKGNYK